MRHDLVSGKELLARKRAMGAAVEVPPQKRKGACLFVQRMDFKTCLLKGGKKSDQAASNKPGEVKPKPKDFARKKVSRGWWGSWLAITSTSNVLAREKS